MRTSLNDIQQGEDYLAGTLAAEAHLHFAARLSASQDLRINLYYQQQAMLMVKLYHKQQLKHEIQQAEQRIFDITKPNVFQNLISKIFNQNL